MELVVGWGHPWGGVKRAKLAKNELSSKMDQKKLKKIKDFSNEDVDISQRKQRRVI